MGQAPYRFVDRRGTNYGSSGRNQLFAASNPNDERRTPPELNRDTPKILTPRGRRTLVNLSKMLYGEFPALSGMIKEQANLSIGTFLPQWYGDPANRTWGKLAESWLVDEWLPMCDIRGGSYDGDSLLDLHVIGELREGDFAVLLTEFPGGYPAVQIIPTHRIRSPWSVYVTAKVRLYQDQMWIDGVLVDQNRPYIVEDPVEWDAPVCDGAIKGPFGGAIGFRIYEDSDNSYGAYQDVSARNLILRFTPEFDDQDRGIPMVGSSGWDWQDVQESRRFSLAAQKVESALYAWETNQTGSPSRSQALVQQAMHGNDAQPQQVTQPAIIELKGGIRYVQSGSGAKVEFPSGNRPSQQSQDFQKNILRDCFAGGEWSYVFGLDTTGVGGAPLRMIVDRVNRFLQKRRRSPRKTFKRVVGYAISKAMAIGVLPWNDNWYMWDFQGPRRMTADARYDSDVSLQEIKTGLTSWQVECAARGEYWEDVQDQNIAYVKRLNEECAKAGVDPNMVLMLTPNGNPPGQQQDDQQQEDGDGKEQQ